MRKIYLILPMLLGFSIAAISVSVASAHGGVAQLSGNAIVTLNQQPISPLVGESVAMNFVVTDKNYQPLRNLPLKLTLIDTFFNDASKDQTILTQNLQTDANGFVSFEHTFSKEDYFDVHLDFKEPDNDQAEQVGFLVQPRRATAGTTSQIVWRYVAVAAIGLVVGTAVSAQIFKKKNKVG